MEPRRQSDRRSHEGSRFRNDGNVAVERRRRQRRRNMAHAGLLAAAALAGGRFGVTRWAQQSQPEHHRQIAPETDRPDDGVTEDELAEAAEDANVEPILPGDDREDRARKIEPLIQEAAAEHKVDADLLRAVVQTESQFDPAARSGAGALGLMQLMPRTARYLGVGNPLDPRENVLGGAKYLSSLLERHKGNIPLALASYNAGPGNVDRWRGVPPFGETQGYIRKIRTLLLDSDAALAAQMTPPPAARLVRAKAHRTAVRSARARARARHAVTAKARAATRFGGNVKATKATRKAAPSRARAVRHRRA